MNDPDLARVLEPGEHVVWTARTRPRRATVGTATGGLIVIAMFSSVFAVLGSLVWGRATAAETETTSDGPLTGFAQHFPILLASVAVGLLVVRRRRIFVGIPARTAVVTDRRAMVVGNRRGFDDQILRSDLTNLTRVGDGARNDVLWRIRQRQSPDNGASSVIRYGFMAIDDTKSAEAALIDPWRWGGTATAAPPTAFDGASAMRMAILPLDEQHLLEQTLHPGEQVRWCDVAQVQPLVQSMMRLGKYAFPIGVLIFGGGALWQSRSLAGGSQTGREVWLTILGVVILALAVSMLTIRSSQRQSNELTSTTAVYAVADARALIVQQSAGGQLLVNTYLPNGLGDARLTHAAQGPSIRLTRETRLPRPMLISQSEFVNLQDGDGAVQAITALVRSARPA